MTDEDAQQRIAPMRVQLKVDDGSDGGLWLTAFEGWTDLAASGRALDEAAVLGEAIQLKDEPPNE